MPRQMATQAKELCGHASPVPDVAMLSTMLPIGCGEKGKIN
jgi:hypothetical protein